MRDVAGTLVRQAMVAENAVREVVCTFSISGVGPTGWGVVVVNVVVSLGAPAAGWKVTLGRARNVRSLTYGALKVTSALPAAVEREGELETVPLPTADTGRRPGVDGPPVSRPVGVTGLPPGVAKVKGACAALALADAAGTGVEPEPGRASLKPIVEPATTASRSQQMVRRGTF
jgi:hypothetical protein